jgi:hypothetical protein
MLRAVPGNFKCRACFHDTDDSTGALSITQFTRPKRDG